MAWGSGGSLKGYVQAENRMTGLGAPTEAAPADAALARGPRWASLTPPVSWDARRRLPAQPRYQSLQGPTLTLTPFPRRDLVGRPGVASGSRECWERACVFVGRWGKVACVTGLVIF